MKSVLLEASDHQVHPISSMYVRTVSRAPHIWGQREADVGIVGIVGCLAEHRDELVLDNKSVVDYGAVPPHMSVLKWTCEVSSNPPHPPNRGPISPIHPNLLARFSGLQD